MPSTRVVILAAGKGTRMKSDIPKPLIPVAGEPMVLRLVKSVIASGIDAKPVVVVGAWSEAQFRDVLKDSVDYAVQTEQLGTGHALRSAKIAVGNADRVVVLYGDHPFIRSEVIQGLSEMQESNPGAIAMLTATVPNFDDRFAVFARWGRVLRDADGKIVGIREAKDATPEELAILEVNPALFAFPLPWAWNQLELLKNTNASGEYYLTDLVGAAMNDGMPIVSASADSMDIIGINSPEELAQAEAMRKG